MKDRALEIGVLGANGRMGRAVLAAALTHDDIRLVAAAVRAGSAFVGQDVGLLAGLPPAGIETVAEPAEIFAAARCVIDFTMPAAVLPHVRAAAEAGTPLVIGTTGLSPDQEEAMRRFAGQVPVIHAANMSVGVNVLQALTEKAAAVLGPDYDIEIAEMHHRHKLDAPSGTALALGRAAAAGRGDELDALAEGLDFGRVAPRESGRIGFSALRGEVIGEHSVYFAGPGERLELTHRAGDRLLFARGALTAARWLVNQPPGLYSMRDVLGLSAL